MRNILTVIISAAAAMLLASCGGKDSAVIKAGIEGLQEKQVVLSMLNVDRMEVVDTLATDKRGNVRFKVSVPYSSPNFYYLRYNGRLLASMIVAPGDNIEVTADTLGTSVLIKGSEEAKLYNDMCAAMAVAQNRFDSLTVRLIECNEAGDAAGAQRLRLELGRFYVKEKRAAVLNIVSNPYSFTNIMQLFRQFSENLPLFAQLTDGIYYSQVCDSLKPKYPESPYVKALEREVVRFNNSMELSNRIQQASETDFPEITAADVNGVQQSLSSFSGKPFILLFWSLNDAQKMLNAELETIYARYKDKGLRIYSVCVDTDKVSWAQVVKRLPWVNVCDGNGTTSKAVASYNITQVPTLFLFDKTGGIAGKDIFDTERLSAAVAKLF